MPDEELVNNDNVENKSKRKIIIIFFGIFILFFKF